MFGAVQDFFYAEGEVRIQQFCVLVLQVITGHEVFEGTSHLGDVVATEVGL